ncbi:MAG: rhamnogalacturonan lyase [Polyangiaceae bacterium]
MTKVAATPMASADVVPQMPSEKAHREPLRSTEACRTEARRTEARRTEARRFSRSSVLPHAFTPRRVGIDRRSLRVLLVAVGALLLGCEDFGHGKPPVGDGGATSEAGSAGSGGTSSSGTGGASGNTSGSNTAVQGGTSFGSTTALSVGGIMSAAGGSGASGATNIGGTRSEAGSGAISGGSGGVSAGGTKASTSGGTSFQSVGGASTGGTKTSTSGGTSAGGAGGTRVTTGGSSAGGASAGGATGSIPVVLPAYQLEALDRGLVAIQSSTGIYVGWRMLGSEYDEASPTRTSYDVYRDGLRIASVSDSTNYVDAEGAAASLYSVHVVIDGEDRGASAEAPVWNESFLSIPLSVPSGGVTDRVATGQTDAAYTYDASDGSTADLNGDGRLDIVLKWEPTNSRDNSVGGFTGNTLLDAYELDGTFLFRIDLGRNIRSGAHYTQFVVYDFDGDGRAEIAVKTAPGTKDGTGAYLHLGPAASDTDDADYRNDYGYVLTGPEYLTVFDGLTGAELTTVNFEIPRGTVSDWGDGYGNRVDRFLASAAFVSDTGVGQNASGRPSILMARGYYTRATVTAWNYREGVLARLWTYDSAAATVGSAAGQGAHSMVVADVDDDGAQEVIYGAATIDSTGGFKCSTGFGHGDALHVTDLIPARPGLEVFMPHENKAGPSYDVRDANTCEVIVQGPVRNADTGRGVAADILPGNEGAEIWASGSTLLSATTGLSLGSVPTSVNFLLWWDGDESRELLDKVTISKYGAGPLLTCATCASNNGTKATPVLTADLLGDWREEVIWRAADNSALLLFTTPIETTRRIYTLMHDAQYRMQVSSQQTGYNQPPHPSFVIGNGMGTPPMPRIMTR